MATGRQGQIDGSVITMDPVSSTIRVCTLQREPWANLAFVFDVDLKIHGDLAREHRVAVKGGPPRPGRPSRDLQWPGTERIPGPMSGRFGHVRPDTSP